MNKGERSEVEGSQGHHSGLEKGKGISARALLALVSGHNTSAVFSLLYPDVILSISYVLGLEMERASSGKKSFQELLLSSGFN